MKKHLARRVEKVAFFLATGCLISVYAPIAPGTVGSFPFLALVYLISQSPIWAQVAVSLALAAAAVPICSAAEKRFGIKDDGRIVADEWMLLPLAFVGIPVSELPFLLVLGMFAVVRAVDIIKPYPCRGLQRFKGGFGIVVDDFVAALYSLGLNWLIYIALC